MKNCTIFHAFWQVEFEKVFTNYGLNTCCTPLPKSKNCSPPCVIFLYFPSKNNWTHHTGKTENDVSVFVWLMIEVRQSLRPIMQRFHGVHNAAQGFPVITVFFMFSGNADSCWCPVFFEAFGQGWKIILAEKGDVADTP